MSMLRGRRTVRVFAGWAEALLPAQEGDSNLSRHFFVVVFVRVLDRRRRACRSGGKVNRAGLLVRPPPE